VVNGKIQDRKGKISSIDHDHNILIVGDSHARNCASEVKQIVGNRFEVSGIVKPGARMEEIVNTVSRGSEKLTKKDIVVVWGGTQDVAKNETEKGLHQIKNMVEHLKQTNLIVMSVPHRYDLEDKSCVNEEVQRFNRKLRKIVKVHSNVKVIELDCERDCFTTHGLHMNFRGKEQTAIKISGGIMDILKGNQSNPIIVVGKDEQGIEKEESHVKALSSERRKNNQREENAREGRQERTEACIDGEGSQVDIEQAPIHSTRLRRLPANRREDFLWGEPNRKYKTRLE
jgi:hypothetical protein